jgi:hypothetical protein
VGLKRAALTKTVSLGGDDAKKRRERTKHLAMSAEGFYGESGGKQATSGNCDVLGDDARVLGWVGWW